MIAAISSAVRTQRITRLAHRRQPRERAVRGPPSRKKAPARAHDLIALSEDLRGLRRCPVPAARRSPSASPPLLLRTISTAVPSGPVSSAESGTVRAQTSPASIYAWAKAPTRRRPSGTTMDAVPDCVVASTPPANDETLPSRSPRPTTWTLAAHSDPETRDIGGLYPGAQLDHVLADDPEHRIMRIPAKHRSRPGT